MLASAVRSALLRRFEKIYGAARISVIARDRCAQGGLIAVRLNSLRKIVYSAPHGCGPSARTRQLPSIPPLCLGGILSFLGLEQKEEVEEDPIVRTIKLGILALQRAQYKKAEKMLHLALKMSQERMDAQAETYCYDVLADIALAHGELDKAEKLYVEVMRRLISAGTAQDDNAIIEISAKLANIFSARRDDGKAEQGYLFCIDTQQNKIADVIKSLNIVSLTREEEDALALWGMCMDWYSKHLTVRGKYVEARGLLTQCLDVARKIFGEAHEQTLVIQNDLALIHTMLKDYDESIRLLEQIINMIDVDGEQSENLPAFLCNLGESYMKSGNLDKAQENCERARDLAKRQNNTVALKGAESCLEDIKEKRNESSTKIDTKTAG